MAARKPRTKTKATAKAKATKPKAVKPASRAEDGDITSTLKDAPEILVDHVYRGPHHGADGVSDLRVVSISKDGVTVEPTTPPHRQATHKMGAFRGWVREDVTKGYESIPKARETRKG